MVGGQLQCKYSNVKAYALPDLADMAYSHDCNHQAGAVDSAHPSLCTECIGCNLSSYLKALLLCSHV